MQGKEIRLRDYFLLLNDFHIQFIRGFNIGIWIPILAALVVILGGSLWLKKLGYPVLGTILLLVLAIPGLLYGLFIFLTIVTKTSWN